MALALNITFDSIFPIPMLGAWWRCESSCTKFLSPLMLLLVHEAACFFKTFKVSQNCPLGSWDTSCCLTTSRIIHTFEYISKNFRGRYCLAADHPKKASISPTLCAESDMWECVGKKNVSFKNSVLVIISILKKIKC